MKNRKITLCNEPKYKEFPELLFGKSVENGIIYFDASHYLSQKEIFNDNTVICFEKKVEMFIEAISEVYETPAEELIIKNDDTGHILIEESLALLFIAYLDSGFAVYLLERLSEMFITGLVLSDMTLAVMVRDRFSKDDINNIYPN